MQPARPAGLTGILIVFALLAATPARAEITQKDLDFFLEESYGQFVDPGDFIDMEGVLHAAAEGAKTPQGTVSAFAGALGLPEDEAERYAALIIASVRHREACEGCKLSDNAALLELIRTTGFEDRTGQILLAVGKNVATMSAPEADYIPLIRDHPAQKVIALGLYDYTKDFVYVLSLLGTGSLDANSLFLVLADGRFENGAYELAAMDAARDRLKGRARLLMSRILMDRLIETGLTREAVRQYSHIARPDRPDLWPAPERNQRIWVSEKLAQAYAALKAKSSPETKSGTAMAPSVRPGKDRFAEEIRASNVNSMINLAAALHYERRSGDSGRLLNQVKLQHPGLEAVQRMNFLKEIQRPSLGGDEIFEVLIEGREDEKKFKSSETRHGPPGWLDSLNSGAPVFEELGSRYLSARGYPAMAR